MHLANQSSGEARHTIPEFTKLDKLSQSSMRGDPRYKGSPQASKDNPAPSAKEN